MGQDLRQEVLGPVGFGVVKEALGGGDLDDAAAVHERHPLGRRTPSAGDTWGTGKSPWPRHPGTGHRLMTERCQRLSRKIRDHLYRLGLTHSRRGRYNDECVKAEIWKIGDV